jgi:hypothetical protein
MTTLTNEIARFSQARTKIQSELDALNAAELAAITNASHSLVGRKLVIKENVSPRTKGNFTYLVTKIRNVFREFNGWHDTYVVEYTAELVEKPKKFRPDYNKELGKTFRKRVTVDRLGKDIKVK